MRSGLQMDVHEHATVQALMQVLGVPNDLPRIVLVNGQHAGEDRLLTDGDVVSVFPPLIGGCTSSGT
jgi:molybdopterin converting factor small subunit